MPNNAQSNQKIKSHLKNTLFAFALTLFGLPTIAADFGWSDGALVIKGTIEQGDYEKMIAAYKFMGTFPQSVYLSSNGGNVREAMKIGRLIRQLDVSASVWEGHSCASACLLILIGSTNRLVMTGARIGLHRTYIDPVQFASLSATEASYFYDQLKGEVSDYLKEMGSPRELVERMYSIPSDDVMWLANDEFYSLVPVRPEYIVELSLAKCGKPLTKTEDDIVFGRLPVSDVSVKNLLSERYFKHMNCEMNLASIERKSFIQMNEIKVSDSVRLGNFDFDITLTNGKPTVKRGKRYEIGDAGILGQSYNVFMQ